MKTYKIDLYRTERVSVECQAASPQEAIVTAKLGHSGFFTDGCVELDQSGEAVAEHNILAQCECCDKIVFDAAEYKRGVCGGEDGIFICETCQPRTA